jgi:DNA-binding NtrC family response regulator
MTEALGLVSKMQTILLVDDDQSILVAWKRIMQLEGYRVETADDGEAGLTAADKVRPVLVITDHRCPEWMVSSFAINSGTSRSWRGSL